MWLLATGARRSVPRRSARCACATQTETGEWAPPISESMGKWLLGRLARKNWAEECGPAGQASDKDLAQSASSSHPFFPFHFLFICNLQTSKLNLVLKLTLKYLNAQTKIQHDAKHIFVYYYIPIKIASYKLNK